MPGTECRGPNGRRQLFDHVKSFMADLGKDLKDKQVNAKVTNLLMKHRVGVIMPERTKKGCIKKTVGAPSSSTKVEKDKTNKKLNNSVNSR